MVEPGVGATVHPFDAGRTTKGDWGIFWNYVSTATGGACYIIPGVSFLVGFKLAVLMGRCQMNRRHISEANPWTCATIPRSNGRSRL